MAKTRICRGCYQPFAGRRDARTCSPRCRKRLQRTREELHADFRHSPARRYPEISRQRTGGSSVVSRAASARRAGKGGKHLLVLLVSLGIFLAASLSHGVMAAVSQGFVTEDKTLRQYMAVSLSGDNAAGHPLVESSSVALASNAIGVAVGLRDSLITVAPASSEVYVVSAGPTKVYVSDVNGKPKKGDLLAVSPLKGVLMKSTDQGAPSFGVALQNFDAEPAQDVVATDKDGKPRNLKVAIEQVNIAINPPLKSNVDASNDWLKSLGANLTGQQVSGLRVLAALAIFFTLMVVEGEIIYSTVSSSITAMGRNPLAKRAIARQSARSAIIAAVILLAGAGVIALLVWF